MDKLVQEHDYARMIVGELERAKDKYLGDAEAWKDVRILLDKLLSARY